ncbi:MAG: GDP-mannose 4,6-dehydratase, partial [Candidatus Coatesbacteria bacterium]|nr:GDP-mannose 4,6-dehydratase [Candidatus Coatesbacteria bacterium]
SKASAEVLAQFYARAHDLPVIIVRAFNHTGPRQAPNFVCSAFARQIASIAAGKSEPVIRVGNLEARRDFLDVRDVARAYVLALERGRAGGIYNVCSGRVVSIREILEMLLTFTGGEIRVEVSQELLRPLDIPVLFGSYERFASDTGWAPEIPFQQTLRDLFDYWLAVETT